MGGDENRPGVGDIRRDLARILDNQLRGLSGMGLLKRITAATSDTAVILITGHADVPAAVSAMKGGAFHFVEKPPAEVIIGVWALSMRSRGRGGYKMTDQRGIGS